MAGELNSTLRTVVVRLRPYNGKPGILEAISTGKVSLGGMTEREVVGYLDELEERRCISVEPYGENDYTVHFKSAAMSAVRDHRAKVALLVFDHVFQLAIGASGGLVVWALSSLIH